MLTKPQPGLTLKVNPGQTPHRAAASRTLAVFVLALVQCLLTTVALAQIGEGDRDLDYGGPNRPPDEERPTLTLSGELPPARAFDKMVVFETDGTTPNRFAIDPASVQLAPRYVLATVAVQSPSGATTTGYYGFACSHLQYRLMAYATSDNQWRVSSKRARWREVRDGEGRNRQFRAVYGAACRLGGRSVSSIDELLRHLHDGREVQAP